MAFVPVQYLLSLNKLKRSKKDTPYTVYRRVINIYHHFLQDFLSSKQAISFFIRLYRLAPNIQLEWQNEKTSEKFELKAIDGEVLLSRHPIGANEKWIEVMSKMPNNEFRNITIS
jgi:hypothetical protein